MWNYRILQYSAISLLGILFFVAVWVGFRAGQATSRAKLALTNAEQITKALGYFKDSQGRYPSLLEYADRNVMLDYTNIFPIPSVISNVCPSVYEYQNTKPQAYVLRVCIPRAYGGYLAGWNEITSNGAQ